MNSVKELVAIDPLWKGGLIVVGCRFTTLEFLNRALFDGLSISGIVTIGQDVAERQEVPAWEDLKAEFGDEIPVYVARTYKLSAPEDIAALQASNADVGICVGWQRLLPDWFLNTCRNGVFGMHACQFPLPQGRGRSPINWSLIDGAEAVHAHTFRYEAVADAGKILDITKIPIEPHDDVHTVQQKCRVMLNAVVLGNLDGLLTGNVQLMKERPDTPIHNYPKRSPKDGKLDWSWSVRHIIDFVRAQTRPYPGAFVVHGSKEYRIWRCTSFPAIGSCSPPPGTVVERFADGSLVVAAGDGNLYILDHELPLKISYGDRIS